MLYGAGIFTYIYPKNGPVDVEQNIPAPWVASGIDLIENCPTSTATKSQQHRSVDLSGLMCFPTWKSHTEVTPVTVIQLQFKFNHINKTPKKTWGKKNDRKLLIRWSPAKGFSPSGTFCLTTQGAQETKWNHQLVSTRKQQPLTQMFHVWYIYLHHWVIPVVDIGENSSTMDPMGNPFHKSYKIIRYEIPLKPLDQWNHTRSHHPYATHGAGIFTNK